MRRRLVVATRLLMSGALVAVATTLLASPVTAETIDAHDSTANRSRTIKAYQEDSGTIFEISFTTATAGEKRRVVGNVNASMPSSASDDNLMVVAGVHCTRAGSGTVASDQDQISDVQNVLRGHSLVLRPRLVFTAGSPGDYRCWLSVGSGRPRPASPDSRPSSNVYQVASGSYLEATSNLDRSAAQGYRPSTPYHLLGGDDAYDAAVLNWTAPAGISQFKVSGDVQLTACTAVGGSTDPVTGKVLCEGHKDTTGATVLTAFQVMQRKAGGAAGYCAVTTFPGASGRRTFISKDVHHLPLFADGTAAVSTASGCGRNFRIKVYVKHLSGSAVFVHSRGTITAAIPTPTQKETTVTGAISTFGETSTSGATSTTQNTTTSSSASSSSVAGLSSSPAPSSSLSEASARARGRLPFTGSNALPVLIAGLMLFGIGAAVLRAVRSR
jgi:hypothetical protein